MPGIWRPPTDTERELLRIPIDVFRTTGEWPVFQYVEMALEKKGLEVHSVLERIPFGWFIPDKRTYGGTTYVAPQDHFKITVIGLYYSGEAPDIQSQLFSCIRWATAQRDAFEMPSPNEYVEPTWSFSDFLQGLGQSDQGAIKPNDATFVLELVNAEPDLPHWSGSIANLSERRIEIPSRIHRYVHIHSLHQYVAIREKELSDAHPSMAIPSPPSRVGTDTPDQASTPAQGAVGIGPEMAGALARFWAGGDGPSHSAISTAFSLAGYEDVDEDKNKEDRVRLALRTSSEEIGRRLVEELLALLRSSGIFDTPGEDPRVKSLMEAFQRNQVRVSDAGFVDWAFPSEADSINEPQEAESIDRLEFEAPHRPGSQETTIPTVQLLAASLRRLASALRPLTIRRRDRQSLAVDDEYDLQDVVESLLRSLYNDVRHEERTPSYAGSSSTIDFLLREQRVAIEVKVTRKGRSEKQIKQELLVDINDYEGHPSVETLIAVVYDLASTFDNPNGFERDLSGKRGSLTVDVLVVGWPLPPR